MFSLQMPKPVDPGGHGTTKRHVEFNIQEQNCLTKFWLLRERFIVVMDYVGHLWIYLQETNAQRGGYPSRQIDLHPSRKGSSFLSLHPSHPYYTIIIIVQFINSSISIYVLIRIRYRLILTLSFQHNFC